MSGSSTRERQAFNDGRLAFAHGQAAGSCTRKSAGLRAAWLRGYEHERRLRLAEKVTPEQRAEAATVARRLKDWAATL